MLSARRERIDIAAHIIERCRTLARITDVPGNTTRTFLSPAMRTCMNTVKGWMENAGMSVSVDAVGNLRGLYSGAGTDAPRLILGSHLDTVPNAGAFDGVLGVLLSLALIESLGGRRLSFALELVGFSEEEGIRFGIPFIGSRALAGRIDESLLLRKDKSGVSVREAMRGFGLDVEAVEAAALDQSAIAYLEFHIEQGPVLESLDMPLAVVDTIVGQTRGEMVFTGATNHAGTTPMHLRHDPVAAAAQWICRVEEIARSTRDLVATVGRVETLPGAGNVIAGEARASLDIRHANDEVRINALETLVDQADFAARQRGLQCHWRAQMHQPAIQMDTRLSQIVCDAIRSTGVEPLRMSSGAGHDAMVMAERLPSAMVFLRSLGGISHHPDETVRHEDVAKAVDAGLEFLRRFDEAIIKAHA
ncbi:allantoate amidohydrolase [Edaphobacter modestus]|nr:allantoate amidohydrolase [Edaphobacter modestus]